ncbi:hypothetical protein SDRG_01132 [Saprolegnia diclina VS20]|uniref:PDZ domain-containing protein n=1 Tax=Saprolegnia diclina (strain VS20) TaxID=1156394 RepID=T0QSL3_SAPDV|nr:hypothetical protein SDRG_01132 [Saprolegnia diclina VS20]EQC41154.1 hypothetical protein SDRG_01132 [Saprolegnia diclina VS20]|eukprot:XP_008604868.1 hypothetical protein SDRG_01132 [Saprolegnia diclina VS20]
MMATQHLAGGKMDARIEDLALEMQATLARLGASTEPSNQDEEDDEAPSELAVSLPELIHRMQAMVEVMERQTEMYDVMKVRLSYVPNDADSRDSRSSLWLNDAGRDSVYTGNRGSLVGYFDSSRGSESFHSSRSSESFHSSRGSEPYYSRHSEKPSRMPFAPSSSLSSLDTPEEEPRQSFSYSEAFKRPATSVLTRQRKTYQKPAPVTVESLPTQGRRRLDVVTPVAPLLTGANSEYSVRWASGDLGISLNNFSSDRRGLQISSLERCASGVAAGIGNARLGDVLVSINKEVVEHLPYDQIKDVLKKTRRPMQLGFRSNPSSVTSPTSAKRYASSQKTFEEEVGTPSALTTFKDEPSLSMASTVDSEVDELEDWLRRQDAMHSELVLLLTETIQRCESLKEENFDQLQLMMQRSMKRRNSTFLRRDSRDF